jgi:branched-chain amino acid transport system ATP-binding protein
VSLNCLEIDAVLHELDAGGSLVQGIVQATYDSLVLNLYRPGRSFFLFVSLSPRGCRIHETKKPVQMPPRPLRFNEFLKARISGSHVERIEQLGADRIVRMGISQVPEGRLIFPDMTVMENLDLGAFVRSDKAGIQQDLDYVFGLFPILAERRKQMGGTLSGGEQQMLAISRALMARPRLLLLDEPSLGLAPIIITQIFDIIRKVNATGTTVFLVEQNANQALKVAHRGYVMENGAITMSDSASNLLSNEAVKKAYLGL